MYSLSSPCLLPVWSVVSVFSANIIRMPESYPYRISLSLYTYFPVCIIDFERGVRRCYFYFRNLIPAGILCITY